MRRGEERERNRTKRWRVNRGIGSKKKGRPGVRGGRMKEEKKADKRRGRERRDEEMR